MGLGCAICVPDKKPTPNNVTRLPTCRTGERKRKAGEMSGQKVKKLWLKNALEVARADSYFEKKPIKIGIVHGKITEHSNATGEERKDEWKEKEG